LKSNDPLVSARLKISADLKLSRMGPAFTTGDCDYVRRRERVIEDRKTATGELAPRRSETRDHFVLHR
jgi:hypothetical protein